MKVAIQPYDGFWVRVGASTRREAALMTFMTCLAVTTTALAAATYAGKKIDVFPQPTARALFTDVLSWSGLPPQVDDIALAYADGLVAENDGQGHAAFDAYRRAAVRYPAGKENSDIPYVQRLRKFALATANVGHANDAERLLLYALSEEKQTLQGTADSHGFEALILADLAKVNILRGSLTEAEVRASHAVARATDSSQEGRRKSLNSAYALDVLAQVYGAQKRPAEAISTLEQAQSLDKQVTGALSPSVGRRMERMAGLMNRTNRPDEALALTAQALISAELDPGVTRDDLLYRLNDLAEIYRQIGQPDQANQLYAKAIGIAEALYGRGSRQTALPLYHQGLIAQSASDLAMAEKKFRVSLDIFKRTFGVDHPATVQALYSTEQLLKSQGRRKEAEILANTFSGET